MLNVSYDPTRELWREMNASFIDEYERDTGIRLTIHQSHGGSTSQAGAVIHGLEADVVTLALWTDIDVIRRHHLIRDGWQERPPNGLPYYSTIVFVVRRGNPKNIKDWPDLLKPGVAVITPNPKTSGNGRLSFLAAWGAVLYNKGKQDGTDEEAQAFVTELYKQVPVLDSGARGSTTTFAQKKIGDVHLTWENEAFLEVAESKGELEIVYPGASLKAEPFVAVVDANVDQRGTRKAAEAYLRFLYTEKGQAILAKHHYRPFKVKHPRLELFEIHTIARDWDEAQQRFFATGALFDRIYRPR